MASPPPAERGSQRTRLLLAGGITALLVALVVAVLALTGSEADHEFDPAPADCVDAWNGDSATLVQGQHQASAHGYSRVQVVRFGTDGAIVPSSQVAAPCGVVFASSSLDSELAAAALIQDKGRTGFRPLSGGDVGSETLMDLQLGAQEDYNAFIQPDGTLDPL